MAVDENATVLRARSPDNQSLQLEKTELALRDLSGNETTFSSPGEPAQVSQASFNDRYVVWMESTSVDLNTDPWVMYVYDRESTSVMELTRAPEVGNTAPPHVPGYTGPVLSGDKVFWAQVGGTLKRPSSNIMGCSIADCMPKTVIPGAAFPSTSDGQLYAIAHQNFAGSGSDRNMVIKTVSVEGGDVRDTATIPLSPTQSPNGLAVGKAGMVWLISDDADRDMAQVQYAGNAEVSTVESELAGRFDYPVATDTYLAWGEGSGSSAIANFLTTSIDNLYALGTTGGLFGVLGAGSVVVWRDQTTAEGGGQDGSNIYYSIARLTGMA
jgi:hypothetical protein